MTLERAGRLLIRIPAGPPADRPTRVYVSGSTLVTALRRLGALELQLGEWEVPASGRAGLARLAGAEIRTVPRWAAGVLIVGGMVTIGATLSGAGQGGLALLALGVALSALSIPLERFVVGRRAARRWLGLLGPDGPSALGARKAS